jgi:hypothetical protein
MIAGPLLVALGAGLLAIGRSDADYFKHFLPGLVAVGSGMALAIPPLTKSALSVGTRFSGSASGFNNAVSRIASLLAVAVLGAVIVSSFSTRLAENFSESILSERAQAEILSQYDRLGGIEVPEDFSEQARTLAETAIHSSFIHAYRLVMLICVGLTAAGSVISALTIRRGKRRNRRNGPRLA